MPDNDVTFSIAPISTNPCESDISSKDFVVKISTINCNITGNGNDFRFCKDSQHPFVTTNWIHIPYLNNLYGGRNVYYNVAIEDRENNRAVHPAGSYSLKWEFVHPNTGQSVLLGIVPGLGITGNSYYQNEGMNTTTPDLVQAGWTNHRYALLRITILSSSDNNQSNNVVEIPIGDTQESGQGDPRIVSTKIVNATELDISKRYTTDALQVATERWHLNVPGQVVRLACTYTLPGSTTPTTLVAMDRDRLGMETNFTTPWIDGQNPLKLIYNIPIPSTMPVDSQMTISFDLDSRDMCRSENEINNTLTQTVKLKNSTVTGGLIICMNNPYIGFKLSSYKDSCRYRGRTNSTGGIGVECTARNYKVKVQNSGGTSTPITLIVELTHPVHGTREIKRITVPTLLPSSSWESDSVLIASYLDKCEKYDSGYIQLRYANSPEIVQKQKVYYGYPQARVWTNPIPTTVTVGDQTTMILGYESAGNNVRVIYSASNCRIDSVQSDCIRRITFTTPGIATIIVAIRSDCNQTYVEKIVTVQVLPKPCTSTKPTLKITVTPNRTDCGTLFWEKTGTDIAKLSIESTSYINTPFVSNVQVRLSKGTYTASVKVCDTTYLYTFTVSCTPTAIQEKEDEIQVTISPNPFQDNIIVKVEEKGEIIVRNILGQTLQSQKLEKGENTIDTHSLTNGMYLLEIQINGRMLVRKIVKD